MQYILDYIHRFPKLEEKDLVKIVYQRIYGSAHMLNNLLLAHDELLLEWSSCDTKFPEPIIPISATMVQVSLKSIKDAREMEQFFAKFVASSKACHGSAAAFDKEIEALCTLIRKKKLSYDLKLIHKLAENRVPLSHSKAFKEAYEPHYRIMLKSFL